MNKQVPVFPAQSERIHHQAGFRSSFADFRDLLNFLSEARSVVLICVLLSLTAALLFIFMSPRLFTAQSSLLVDSNKGQLSRSGDETGNFGIEQAEIETQLQILKSEKIALRVVDRLGLNRDPLFMDDTAPDLPNWLHFLMRGLFSPMGVGGSEVDPDVRHLAALRLAAALNVARVGASYVVSISVTTTTPARAAEIANTLAEAYVTDRVEARLETAQRTNLDDERERELRMRILSSATPPLSPSSPRRRIILGVAAVFGAFFGLGVAFLRRAMDDMVRSPEQVTSTGVRLVAAIPATRFVKGGLRRWVTRAPSVIHYARLNPLSPFAQSVRKIKGAVQIAKTDVGRGFCLGIVSVMCGEGKSTVAGNLGDLLGASGRRTLLLDFDLDLRNRDRKDAQRDDSVSNCNFLDGAKLRAVLSPAEGPPPRCNPSVGLEDLLGSEQMGQFLSQCRQDYEYVLVDCPSAEVLPDTMVVTQYLDALVVVVESGRLPFDLFAEGLSSLGGGSCKVLGVVLNKLGT